MRNTPLGLRSLLAALSLGVIGSAVSGKQASIASMLGLISPVSDANRGGNKARGRGVKANQRAAVKARNVRRHRAVCR